MHAVVYDYGSTTPQRLVSALGKAGLEVTLTSDPSTVRGEYALVLPDRHDDGAGLAKGVNEKAPSIIRQHLASGRPLLAVGFSLQLLLSGKTAPEMPNGLDIFRANSAVFDPHTADDAERPLKVPHVGFSFVVGLDRHPHLKTVVPEGEEGAWFYFRHALCAPARVPFAEVAVAHHGVPFAGAIWRENVLALQFLPELSGSSGHLALKSWAVRPRRGDRMTLAKRVIPVVSVDASGEPARGFQRGGLDVPHLESIARYHDEDGADEIWLHLQNPDERGAAALFDPVKGVRERTAVPLVAWGAIRSSADARLLVGLGADRVIVDAADPAIEDIGVAVQDIANAVGKSAVSVALVTRRRVRDIEAGSVAWELCADDGTPLGRDAVTLARSLADLGAGELVIRPWLQGFQAGDARGHDPELVDRLLSLLPEQLVSVGWDIDPTDLVPALLMGADGVASERLFNTGACTLAAAKEKLATFGIPLRV